MKNLNKNITRKKQNNNFIVYIHIRPDINEPFYVGKGVPKRDKSKYGRNQYWHNFENTTGLKSNGSICLCCQGKRQSTLGYKWKYKNNQYEKNKI